MKHLIIMLLLPIVTLAQFHIAAGTGLVDDTQTTNFDFGYTKFKGNLGIGANYRWTHADGIYIRGLELLPKYKLVKNKKYELHVGSGAGWKYEQGDYYPLLHVRNQIKVDPIWIGVNIETTFKEHYLTFVISIPYFRNYKRVKRFF